MLTRTETLRKHSDPGRAPASKLFPGYALGSEHFETGDGEVRRTRPLCVYPRVARHDGSGSIDDAASFRCVSPD